MQFLGWRHGGTKLQQLQRHAVLQVDLRRLAAAEAAEEAQARPRPLPGGHGAVGSGGAWAEKRGRSLLSGGHDLRKKEERKKERESLVLSFDRRRPCTTKQTQQRYKHTPAQSLTAMMLLPAVTAEGAEPPCSSSSSSSSMFSPPRLIAASSGRCCHCARLKIVLYVELFMKLCRALSTERQEVTAVCHMTRRGSNVGSVFFMASDPQHTHARTLVCVCTFSVLHVLP